MPDFPLNTGATLAPSHFTSSASRYTTLIHRCPHLLHPRPCTPNLIPHSLIKRIREQQWPLSCAC
ncbi:hypothetical protein E2C01_082540 [Portunus trituberculatus]|uniref:Uncharacterized protein n=1 Tax=Portunus trituberculatus TaxID=210409 RepID=A0A5B7J429_PORTR|nr:hypothetical protein [Portunus trituberculatus]